MARLSNISVVVPSPSLHNTPSKSFNDELFDRTIDTILSEEASLEGSRAEGEAMDASTMPSLFGDDRLHDSLALSPRRARSTETKSSHFPTPSPTPVTATTSISEVTKPKSKDFPKIKSTLAMTDFGKDAKKESQKVPKKESKKVARKDSSKVPNEDSTDGMGLDKTIQGPEQALNQTPAKETKESPEEKIFALVSPDKQMTVLQFIASHAFMTTEVQPILRSARRQFTDQVRNVAFAATMNNGSVDALLEFVRKTYLDERHIVAADDAGSAFGDEIDDEEKQPPKPSHKKRSSLSRDQTVRATALLKISEQKDDILDPKKHKRRHSSERATRQGHSKAASILDLSGAKGDAGFTGPKKRKRRHSESATQHAHNDAGTKKVRHSETARTTPDAAMAMDYVEISNTEEVPKEKEPKTHKKRDSASARQHSHDKGGVKSDGSGEDDSRNLLSHDISPGAFKHSVSIPPPSEPAKSKKSNKEKNKRKRVRRKQRRLESRLRLSGHQPDISAEHPVQQMTSPIRQPNTQQNPSEGRSPAHPPLPTDPNLWDLDF
ncbi:hypothetical protein PENARI_c009G11557 [Penicillium arizonense]|uniref:Uncharacterized protein n=1 Tax=Penicillium arizonense TaxID=1835702 RepID=A0A1F5LIA8_PENAI|nr:hypothetical protein PENARI_c009G11557 [Penicillium arizonense]OGE52639.1 hypothetical protein PENARI_c009G11557 [Penicillium arizonense]